MVFRPDIQGLRAIAVLAVMIFHLNPAWLPGGFVGVDIFLVISGFLISSILLHKKAKPDYSLKSTLGYFYTSRLKRIVPAYFTTLIVVSLVAAVLFLPSDFSIYREGLKKAVWFNSNNYFANFGDYFAPANHEQPLLHTWSLAIEIQFYLIAPFIFLLIPKRLLYWLLPLAVVVLTAYAEYRLQSGVQQATYYSLVARLPAFFLGGCAALWIANSNRLRGGDSQKLWLSILAAGLIAFALFNPKPTGYFPGIAGLVPTFAAALIIWLNANNKVSAFLSGITMVWIGALSYSLYLWHWPVLAFMRYYTGAEVLSLWYSLAFVVLTFGLAAASYYWIETPLRLKRNATQIVGYVILCLFAIGAEAGMKKLNKSLSPEPLPIEYRRYADPKTICHGQIVGDCLRGDLGSDKEVLVLGDSHAAMLNHFFDYLGKELNFKARIITASSCVTIPGFDYQRIEEWAHKPCLSQTEEAKKYLENSKAIFLAASWAWQFESEKNKTSVADFVKNVQQPVYIISQEPLLKKHPVRSLRFEYIGLPSKPMTIDPAYMKANKILVDIVGESKTAKFLGLSALPLFKTAPIYGGELMYLDEHHLNEIGAIEYANQAKNIINSLFEND